MKTEIRVRIGEFRLDLSYYLNLVARKGKRIIITVHDKPKAVMISYVDYQFLSGIEATIDEEEDEA